MPTTVTKTIGTGGDYSTLQAWEDACPANLVTADQIWRGEVKNQLFSSSGALLTISGQTTDSTRYVELTTASGASFADNANVRTNALRYNSSNGAAIATSGGYVNVVTISTAYTRMSKLQIQNTSGQLVTGANCTLEQMIVECNWSPIKVNSSPLTLKNCLVILKRSSADHGIDAAVGTLTVYNCTIVRPSNYTAAGFGVEGVYGTITVKNTAIFGFSAFSRGTATQNNNATDLASGAGTSSQTSLTYSSQFENASAGSGTEDFRAKSGGALVDNGVDLSGSGVTTDISGTARGATYDIGAWEYANANVSVSLTGINLTASRGTTAAGIAMSANGSSATTSAGTITETIGMAATGSAATASAGTTASALTAAPSGSAATGSPGTVAGALGSSVAGSAATAAAGTTASAIAMAVSGGALTMSAGSLAYTIGFMLTGAASSASGGTLSASGGDTTQNRALTGIHMTALPGNVRVTGGTRWTPQAPRAETIPAALGNTLQPPPRATGNAVADLQALTQWANTLYDQMVKAYNIIGRVLDHEDRIANLERE